MRRLRNDALKVKLGGVFEHFLPVADQVFGANDWEPDAVLTQKVRQRLLSLDLRHLAKVAVAPKKVEGVIDQPVLTPAASSA
jgi:hypothetical protein